MQSRSRLPSRLALLLVCCGMPLAHARLSADAIVPTDTPSAFMQPVLLNNYRLPGLSPEHMATTLRRRHLSSQKQYACSTLDSKLPVLKLDVRRAPANHKLQAKERLQQALALFAALRC